MERGPSKPQALLVPTGIRALGLKAAKSRLLGKRRVSSDDGIPEAVVSLS